MWTFLSKLSIGSESPPHSGVWRSPSTLDQCRCGDAQPSEGVLGQAVSERDIETIDGSTRVVCV